MFRGPVNEYQASLLTATAVNAGAPDGSRASVKRPAPIRKAALATNARFPIQEELISTDSKTMEGKSISMVTTMNAAGDIHCCDPSSSRAAKRGNMYPNPKETNRLETSNRLRISTGRRNVQSERLIPPPLPLSPAPWPGGSAVVPNFSTALV
jgi:hypothetical protein